MKYIERSLEKELKKYISAPEILAIVGARQVGKTTLIKNILNETKNKTIKKISLDDVGISSQFVNDTKTFIKEYIDTTDILFIDELHYAKDGGKILKYIYDTTKKKIIVSGSSSVDLSIQSLKYLVGRVLSFNLYSFSFYEFLKAKDDSLSKIYLDADYKQPTLKKINKYLEEYLIYGGYPRIVLEEDINKKQKLLKEIYNTYALREIKEIEDLKDDYKLNDLIKALSLQIGNLIDYEELKNISGYHYTQLKNTINILEKTFICKQLRPYYTNKRTELVKSKMIYFYDLGLRNVVINNFVKDRRDLGAIKENFIVSELLRQGLDIKYWRTKSKAEVDIIIDKITEVIPIEVKSKIKNTNLTKSLLSFIDKYNPKQAFVVSDDFEGERVFNKTKVIFLPFVKFIPIISKYK
jgi:uncharacterized protein